MIWSQIIGLVPNFGLVSIGLYSRQMTPLVLHFEDIWVSRGDDTNGLRTLTVQCVCAI